MNKLDLLLRKWKAGSVKDPDLSLCLAYIHKIEMDKRNEREPVHTEGTDSVSGEDHNPKPKRLKAKGL
jgi:hypothetical protein